MKQFLAVAGLTLLETLRQPVLLLLTTSVVVFVALLPGLLMHTLGNAASVVQDSALAVQFVGGLLLGCLAASGSLGREIRRGTMATVLSKPLDRDLFFLAKFAGVAMLLALFAVASGSAALLATHMVRETYEVDWVTGGWLLGSVAVAYAFAGLRNYFTRRPFVSCAFALMVTMVLVAVLRSALGEPLPWRLVPASVLIGMATLLLAAVALALITRLELVPTLAVVSVVFVTGLMTDYLLGRLAQTHWVAALFYNLLPNWQHFWMADALTDPGEIPWVYVRRVAAYAGWYLVGILALGMLAFRNVESKV